MAQLLRVARTATCRSSTTRQSLAFNIANIEDNTFPPELFRAPDDQIQLTKRAPLLASHTLLGINLFALEMFGEFRSELGLYASNPLLPGFAANDTYSSQYTAIIRVLEVARTTASVNILSLQNTGSALQADVKVVNLAGHELSVRSRVSSRVFGVPRT